MRIFMWVWEIFGIVYAFKIAESYNLRKKEEVEPQQEQKVPVKTSKSRFFEA